MRIGVFGVAVLITTLVGACGSSTGGTAVAVATGSETGKEESGGRTGASSPKAAVQALIDGVKEGDKAKVDAAVCEQWPSPVSRGGFAIENELDPPAQRAFPKSEAGEAKQDGDKWTVPVSMPGDQPITVTVVQAGKGYLACGFGLTSGG
nr:hypothetical protein [Kibdelosporangium sp. MJ126-NF4]CEL23057.1 hypothetical protein [Kibdelosporangium sp. MJ126-NF4]